jgi:hypothetical protein
VQKRDLVAALFVFLSASVVGSELTQSPDETFYLMRLLGASLGSTVAVTFELRSGTWRAALTMFGVGATTGYLSSRWILDSFGWMNVADYWLLASGIGGALGYILLQLVYSKKMKAAMERRAGINE